MVDDWMVKYLEIYDTVLSKPANKDVTNEQKT